MCGRLVAETLKKIIREDPNGRTIHDLVRDFVDRYNLAPTNWAVTVHEESGDWAAIKRRWGIDSPKGLLINSKMETMTEQPGYFSQFQRVLVPVSGWYEWPVINGKKRPYYIHPVEPDTHWWFPGLMKAFDRPKEGRIEGFSIMTTAPTAAMSELHHRWPVILGPDGCEAWMDSKARHEDLMSLLRHCPDEWIEAYEVGPAVGNVRNEGADLIKPVA